jgi:hypothetical protein
MMRTAGSLLLHPVHLGALVTLGLNDHWFKAMWPGPVTGKLSDIAGLVVLPVVVVASVELIDLFALPAAVIPVVLAWTTGERRARARPRT